MMNHSIDPPKPAVDIDALQSFFFAELIEMNCAGGLLSRRRSLTKW